MRGNEGADGKDCAAADREHLTAGPGPLVILAIGFRFFFGTFFSTIRFGACAAGFVCSSAKRGSCKVFYRDLTYSEIAFYVRILCNGGSAFALILLNQADAYSDIRFGIKESFITLARKR